jgi:hypothetical protein
MYECAVRAMRMKLKLSFDGGESGSKKCKRGYGGAYGGVWRSLESGGRFCVRAFGKNLTSVAEKMFTHLIYFLKKFYKFCTFNAIFKENDAINFIRLLFNANKFHSRQH